MMGSLGLRWNVSRSCFWSGLLWVFLLIVGCSTTREPVAPELSAKIGTMDFLDPEDDRLLVGFVIFDGLYNTELTAPYDVFHHTVFHAKPGMRVLTIGASEKPIVSFEGLRILPDTTFSRCPKLDVLVIPSGENSMTLDLENEELLTFVKKQGESARYVLSYCDGAFVLGCTGLLDGLHATTYPGDLDRFREMYGAKVRVEEDLSFVHDGRFLTSVGGALCFDSALYLVEEVYGVKAARGVARGLCLDWSKDQVRHLVVKNSP